MQPDQLIGSAAAAHVLGIDRSTLTRWVAVGKITPAVRVSDTQTGAHLYIRDEVEHLARMRARGKAAAA
jgi:predicted site-specific integrase-resolvase